MGKVEEGGISNMVVTMATMEEGNMVGSSTTTPSRRYVTNRQTLLHWTIYSNQIFDTQISHL